MAAIDPLLRDFVLDTSNDLVRAENPTQQAILLRLCTEQGTCFWDPSFGSTLGALSSEKIGQDIARDVEDRARAALKPMVDENAIRDLEVAASRVDRNRVEMALRCVDAGNRPISFNLFVQVG